MSKKIELENLEREQIQCLKDIARIKQQIESASHKARADNDYSDHHWFVSAKRALREKGILNNYLLSECARLRKEIKQEDHEQVVKKRLELQKNFTTAFFNNAKIILDEDTFAKICKLAELTTNK